MKLIQGDCITEMEKLISEGVKVDMVLTDPPYGTTACKWDSTIPFKPMWKCLKQVTEDRTPILLFGSEPFSSNLRMSNIRNYKYDWYWNKTKPSGHLNSKKQPLRKVENILVFYRKQCQYNPQGLIQGEFKHDHPGKAKGNGATNVYGSERNFGISHFKNYPKNVLNYANPNNHLVHPTQKPVSLLEYLIKTYTNKGNTVLDFTMGSGSTGVACNNLGRDFIGIELEEKYYKIAKDRCKIKQEKLI